MRTPLLLQQQRQNHRHHPLHGLAPQLGCTHAAVQLQCQRLLRITIVKTVKMEPQMTAVKTMMMVMMMRTRTRTRTRMRVKVDTRLPMMATREVTAMLRHLHHVRRHHHWCKPLQQMVLPQYLHKQMRTAAAAATAVMAAAAAPRFHPRMRTRTQPTKLHLLQLPRKQRAWPKVRARRRMLVWMLT